MHFWSKWSQLNLCTRSLASDTPAALEIPAVYALFETRWQLLCVGLPRGREGVCKGCMRTQVITLLHILSSHASHQDSRTEARMRACCSIRWLSG